MQKLKFKWLFWAVLAAIAVISQCASVSAQCDELTQRFERPIEYNQPSQMEPDPCHGLNNYNTVPTLLVSPKAGYLERKLKIRATVITEWDADTCVSRTVSTKFDTIITSQVIRPQISDETVGGYYTCRLELMVVPPISAPVGCESVRLPEDHIFKDYWLTTYGHYTTKEAAKQALVGFKNEYSEYCSAFVDYVPLGCEYLITYSSKQHEKYTSSNDARSSSVMSKRTSRVTTNQYKSTND